MSTAQPTSTIRSKSESECTHGACLVRAHEKTDASPKVASVEFDSCSKHGSGKCDFEFAQLDSRFGARCVDQLCQLVQMHAAEIEPGD